MTDSLENSGDTIRRGLAAGRELLKYVESLNRDIGTLQAAFDRAQRERRKHLGITAALLYFALVVNVTTLVKLMVWQQPDVDDTPVYVLAATTLPLVVVVMFIVLHGMTSGKVIPISLGMVRAYADDLHAEFMTTVGAVIPTGDVSRAHERLLEYLKSRDAGLPSAPQRTEWQRLDFTERQLLALAAEVRTANETVRASTSSDLAIASYGFSIICAAVSVVGLLATHRQGNAPAVLLAIVSIVCGVACYLIVRRPTNTQYHIEESLKRLGFSALAVAQRLRAGVVTVPPDLGSEALLERDVTAQTAASASKDPQVS